MRIMFAGPSGIGKTTMAKFISERYNIPYISGSVSDLIPDTKGITHEDMLSRSSRKLELEDWQILNKRNFLFRNENNFVTDRSYIDLAAYFWYKQDRKLPFCEIEHFLECCKELMESQCDILILCPLISGEDWVIEDNNKRIINKFYQIHMSLLMTEITARFEIPTLVINTDTLERREILLTQYLDEWLKVKK